MIEIRKYRKEDKEIWNKFIFTAKNATFLFYRDFMDYHKDKFIDYSLIVCLKNEIIAVMPANIKPNQEVVSHSGLTYGGIVVGKDIRLNLYLEIFASIMQFLNKAGIHILRLKLLPDFYTTIPSQECQYALFLCDAKEVRVDTSLTINQKNPLKFQKRRKRSISKARKGNFLKKTI